jgi:hypothetical protein
MRAAFRDLSGFRLPGVGNAEGVSGANPSDEVGIGATAGLVRDARAPSSLGPVDVVVPGCLSSDVKLPDTLGFF